MDQRPGYYKYVALARYFCITRPTKVVFTKPKVVYAIILIWIYVTFLAAMPLVGWNQYVYVDDRKHCMIFWQMGGVHSAYGVFLSGSTFLVPTWIMVFCYYKIFRTSSQQAKKFRKRVMPTFESTNDNTNSSNVRGHHRSGIPNRDCLFTEEDLKMTCNDTQCKAVSTKNVIDLKPQIAKNGIKSNPVKVLSDGVEAKCDSHSYPMGNTVTVGIQDVGTSSSESSGSASLKHVDHGKITHAAPSQTSGESNTVRKQARERRTAQVILVVIAVFQICWMPYATLNQWSAFSGETPQGTADLATSLLGYFNSACNAFIYTAFNTRFRLAFKQIIWRKNSRTFSQR
ncbi:predicted protein [Nematostella vectensis]|uniref:G-protein coupled receptors family 1 profile domain-containing protein n=1 Tax=Nematostella vectensis TaxID=45351 RepID=A7RYK7_NEMVE|nr:predicted protein [Nematostella vectensis]|eukprot:XP_001635541.1 predicted protein [Nematostella vectensis]